MIKSEINPGQVRKYVGIIFDLRQGLAIAAPNKLIELKIILKKIIIQQGATARQWTSVIGKMGDLMRQIKLGLLDRRPIQWFLQANWNQSKDNWEKFVRLEKKIIPHLLWWCERKNTAQGVPLAPFNADVSLYTDVSQWDYGTTLGDREISGQWTPKGANMHSNNQELLA